MPVARKLRVSAISFLNTAPLMYDFTHEPRQKELAERYEVHFTLPNLCADELASGAADIGLVPVAACATHAELIILPGIAIATLDQVRSIQLVTRRGVALEAVKSVALDSTSRTSAALVRVIFNKFIGANPVYTQQEPALDAMLENSDAALLIGDPALLAIDARDCGGYTCYDLGRFWKHATGMPFVFAVWAMRAGALEQAGLDADSVIKDFQQSRDAGLANLRPLAEEWKDRIALPCAAIREYWENNIYYSLDEPCLQGLQSFLKFAAECDALPAAPSLQFL